MNLSDYEYYRTGRGVLYCGDCLEILPLLEAESVDLIITSPPFNIGNIHQTGNYRHSPYEDNLPENDYQLWQIKILNICYDILSSRGSLFYNHKNRINDKKTITPYVWLLKTNFIFKQELVWFNRSQNFNKMRFYPMTERIYWLSVSKDTEFFNKINHHDLFKWQAVGTSGEHKRAFPIELVSDILQCFPIKSLVLDCFLGSGTTAVVCEKLNRRWIGIEISEAYCKLAKERIESEQDMFTGVTQ